MVHLLSDGCHLVSVMPCPRDFSAMCHVYLHTQILFLLRKSWRSSWMISLHFYGRDGILMTVWPIKPISVYQPSHSSALLNMMCSAPAILFHGPQPLPIKPPFTFSFYSIKRRTSNLGLLPVAFLSLKASSPLVEIWILRKPYFAIAAPRSWA